MHPNVALYLLVYRMKINTHGENGTVFTYVFISVKFARLPSYCVKNMKVIRSSCFNANSSFKLFRHA